MSCRDVLCPAEAGEQGGQYQDHTGSSCSLPAFCSGLPDTHLTGEQAVLDGLAQLGRPCKLGSSGPPQGTWLCGGHGTKICTVRKGECPAKVHARDLGAEGLGRVTGVAPQPLYLRGHSQGRVAVLLSRPKTIAAWATDRQLHSWECLPGPLQVCGFMALVVSCLVGYALGLAPLWLPGGGTEDREEALGTAVRHSHSRGLRRSPAVVKQAGRLGESC